MQACCCPGKLACRHGTTDLPKRQTATQADTPCAGSFAPVPAVTQTLDLISLPAASQARSGAGWWLRQAPSRALRTQGWGAAGGGARRAPGCVAGLISRTPRTRPRMRAAAASAYGPPPDAPARKMRRLGSSLSASASRSAAKLVSVRSGCGSLCASSAACSMFAGCCGLLQCCFVATLLQRCSANQDAWV